VFRAHIELDGLKDFQRDLKRETGKLPKALGEAHKNIGRFIIGKIPTGDPNAVGEGFGSSVRPSATKREVRLMVGHGGRRRHSYQWGRTVVQPFKSGRPYIIGTIEDNEKAIIEEFKRQMKLTVGKAFHESK
jgi:hypothetical protein